MKEEKYIYICPICGKEYSYSIKKNIDPVKDCPWCGNPKNEDHKNG